LKTSRLTLAGILALALLWAGAGAAPAGAKAAGPASAGVAARAGAGLKGLKPAQRKARRRELGNCRKLAVRAKRSRCVRKVERRYRRIARRQSEKPQPPAPPTRIHQVLVTDYTNDPIQSSYFIPIPDQLIVDGVPDFDAVHTTLMGSYKVPAELTISKGEAVRFVWDPANRESAHQVTLFSHPAGVDPRDFEMSGSASTGGITFQRTFTVPGVYELRCSLHQLTQILRLTVTG